jgi:hypothetical protein
VTTISAAVVPVAEAVVPVTVAASEQEELGKKKMSSKNEGPLKKAGQTEVFKHPCRDVWLAGWSHLEPPPSWSQPLRVPIRGPTSPRQLLQTHS